MSSKSLFGSRAYAALLLLAAACSVPDVPKLIGKDGGPDHEEPSGDDEDGGQAPVKEDPGSHEDVDAGESGMTVGNKARVLSVAPTYALAEETYKYHPKSNASEQATWKVDQGPAGVKVEDDGSTVSWTPTSEQKGKHEIVLSAKVGDQELKQTGEITVAVADERAASEIDENVGGSVIVTAPKSRVAGASVYARPASLKSPTRLTISEVDKSPAMGSAKDGSRAVKFGPSGTVFAEPALITLPLSGDGVSNKSRVGAYVYDTKGSWVRVPVVEVDTEKGVVFAKAKHFSLYTAAESKYGIDLSAKLAPSGAACPGALFIDAWLEEPAATVDASVVGNLPAELAALSEGKSLSDLLTLDSFRGSVRLVRVLELAQGKGDQRVSLETRLLVTTLYVPGDGTATLTHSDALGHAIGSYSFGSPRQSLSTLWAHLSGRALRGVFDTVPESDVSLSARMHALYFEGDASRDPVSADDLGFALVDIDAVAISSPASDSKDMDVDCDGLIKAYDGTDDRLLPRLALKPEGVSNGVVKSPLRLFAGLLNAPESAQVSWRVVSGRASLSPVDGAANARDFRAEEPGRFLVEVSADVKGERLSGVFAIDVSPEATLPSCTPSPAVSTLKQGESVGLTAVLADSSFGTSLAVEWGVLGENNAFASSAEIVSSGYQARLTPAFASRYAVACRTVQGSRTGPFRGTEIDVVSAQQNLPPTDLTLSPMYETLLVGKSLTFGASARDPEGAMLRFAWSSKGGTLGAPETQGSRSKVSFSASAPGLYEVRVAIRDQAELAQELNAFVLVVTAASDTDGADGDRDGWPAKLDCDDANPRVHPGAIDRCGDAIDDDCSGSAKTNDCDDDGFTKEQGDCNDGSREIRPGAPERCDGIDNNCDSRADEGFGIGGVCSVGVGQCQTTAKWECSADGFGAVCPAVPLRANPELCDGKDNDCDGSVDEDIRPRDSKCGLGLCQSSGVITCVAGSEQNSCVPKPGAASDLTCNGVDDDCDGRVDQDVARLAEVCNGFDDDCDGTVDENLQCSRPAVSGCTPRGAEVCNGLDDNCDGSFDEGNVCGLTGDLRSLLGAFFLCQNAACTALAQDGFMFLANGAGLKLGNGESQSYDPADGPYCVDGSFSYQVNGDQMSWSWLEGGKAQRNASGTFVLAGTHLTINFTSAPSDMLGVHELVRVPEQAGGACLHGPLCQANEICGNGFDDDCDQLPDAADPNCSATCGTRAVETCDGLDNDCNGTVDDLNQPCERGDAVGVCRMGRMVCSQGAPVCQAGSPDAAGEQCSDGLDNDCDNAVDEAGCAPLTPGETCINAINVTEGGVFTLAKGARNDVPGGCRSPNYVDRMFYITTPNGLSANYTFFLEGTLNIDAGAALYKMPAGYAPGSSCPSVNATQGGMCLAKQGATSQYLDPNSVYVLVVEAAPDSMIQGGSFTLSVARSNDGICSPGDNDGDGRTICQGDCNDARNTAYPSAPELCNNLDDDCDGMIDEQEGTCSTGLPGVCAVGVSECNQTPSCRPVQRSSADYCGDGVDNDCNGQIDDNCVQGAGETCDNAVELGNGGYVSGSLVGAQDDAVSRCGGAGPERFYRFTVPQPGGYVNLHVSGYPSGVSFSLYGDCSLVPVMCGFRSGYLPGGAYRLAVETNAANMVAPFAFTLGISDGETCLTPDADGDGVVACYGDCDESRASVNINAVEPNSCDGLDNNCNGAVDDVRVSCSVPGVNGVCAEGEMRCGPQGSTCVQTRFPDVQGRDICSDGLDNDCDGASDAQDPQSCVSVPPGDTCALAHQVNISAGGTFAGSLVGYQDDAKLGCDYMMAGIERFYTLTLATPRVVRVAVHAPYVAGDTGGMVGVMRVASCAGLDGGAGGTAGGTCSGGSFMSELPAGSHIFAVYGPPGRSYELSVSTQAVGDMEGTTCAPGDLDADGYTLCTGDCREGDGNSHPGAQEVCDGRDNDCNMMADDMIQPGNCAVNGGIGDCAQGYTLCEQGAMVCHPHATPGQNQEICNDGRDNDCDGMGDDRGTAGVDCTLLTGETCSTALPIGTSGFFDGNLNGAVHDGQGCYGGTQGDAEERYYQFHAPVSGDYYVQVRPVGPGPFPPFSWGVDRNTCSGSMPNGGCVGPVSHPVVVFHVSTPGPQFVVVESDDPVAYRIGVASMINGGSTCSLADGDGDGRTLCDYDCDDGNGSVHPGATETCNSRDDNCDGVVDEGC